MCRATLNVTKNIGISDNANKVKQLHHEYGNSFEQVGDVLVMGIKI
jgi:hypothetical protein